MKVSELIQRLQSIKDREGDLDVRSLRSSRKVPTADTWFLHRNGTRYWNMQDGESNKGGKVVAV
jgi:hypothetical protein